MYLNFIYVKEGFCRSNHGIRSSKFEIKEKYIAKFHMERFILKKFNEVEGKEQVSNRFVALEDMDAEVEINSAWEMIRENINISAKESLGYFEFKKHKS
jgi:hypothetical protein